MSSQRIRRDEFDIESRDRHEERRGGSRMSDRRSRSSRRSPHSHQDDDSRSRSRSLERNRRGGGGGGHRRDRYSRSRSHSRGYSRRRNDSGSSRSVRRYRDSRSRSGSRSPAYYRRNRNRDYDRERDYERRNSKSVSRSRSRSSSHFREYPRRDKLAQRGNTKTLKALSEDDSQQSKDSYEAQGDNLEDLPLPQQEANAKNTYDFEENEPIDRERIHREIEEKLRQTLAKEGKVYPPPKAKATHPVFANDGSFLEIFKKMQEQQQLPPKATTSSAAASVANPAVPILASSVVNASTAPYMVATAMGKSAPPPPIVGRRKGGKILKTGVVAKPKVQPESSNDPKDFWSLYLAEVNKYKNTACDSEQGNRPLVK